MTTKPTLYVSPTCHICRWNTWLASRLESIAAWLRKPIHKAKPGTPS